MLEKNPENENEIDITTCDRLMLGWKKSMEMTRDFEMYSKRIEDDKIKDVFKKFAEEEGIHASRLRDLLLEYRNHEKCN